MFDPTRDVAKDITEIGDAARMVWFLLDPAFGDHWQTRGLNRHARRQMADKIWQTQRKDRQAIKRIVKELSERHREEAAKFIDLLKGRMPNEVSNVP